MNDEGIGAWVIKPALHDGRGKQHIIALVVKGRHALFDLRWRHLSVCDDIADLWHFLAQEFLDLGQVSDARGDEEALATAIMLARSEEHTSELQSLMRISYAVFCLKKKTTKIDSHYQSIP